MKLHKTICIFTVLVQLSCAAQTNGKAVGTDGAMIAYRTYGSGKPLLIINGGPGMNSDGFEALAIKLSDGNQTIIYDQRGTGKSVLPKLDSTTITMQLMMQDLESLRKQLHIEKWSILGHSFGGMIASYYAANYPEHIDRLILSSSGGIDLGLLNSGPEWITSRLSKSDQDSLNYWSQRMSDGDTSYFAKLERAKHLAPAYVLDKQYLPLIAVRLTQGNSTINQLMWADLNRIRFDCTPKLKSYTKPVLIIQGDQDIIGPQIAEKSHQAFKNSRVVFMEHCIHYGWLDNETVYFKEVRGFLATAD